MFTGKTRSGLFTTRVVVFEVRWFKKMFTKKTKASVTKRFIYGSILNVVRLIAVEQSAYFRCDAERLSLRLNS